MFLEGGDPIKPELESLAVKPLPQLDEEDLRLQLPTVLMTFRSVAKDDAYQPASRDIMIGCVRTMAVSQKKNGEFSFENVQLIAPKGFTIEPQKGMVEAGILKPVTITWTPPAGYDPNKVMEASVVVTLKGDASEQFRVMLHAMVVSE
ncbi:uncharacterized protein LOC132745958 isoform X2 [Ruditapes philippinarum]|uniref:uncharacterized protein LOC132745958 isoform X2 n=1 Tax=Ruditapes philippinarum TaxID=129788 RepID=UPI00295A8B9D|nr:uncharacterized protein LOC132745958 isoform X2 [Ruditapes philippinarum]